MGLYVFQSNKSVFICVPLFFSVSGPQREKDFQGLSHARSLRFARVAELMEKDGRITYVLKNKTDIRLCVSPRLCERLMGLIAFEV
jgi:hypothetical protein